MFLEMLPNYEAFRRKNKIWPFRKTSQNLFSKFYDKKYTDDYKRIQYAPFSSYYDDKICEVYDKEFKNDEIDKVEDFFWNQYSNLYSRWWITRRNR
jgi:hypothetical protein